MCSYDSWSNDTSIKLKILIWADMRLWHLSPSVNSIFKHACAAIHWGYTSDIWSDPSSTSILYVCEQRRLWRDCADAHSPEPSLLVYAISTIVSLSCLRWRLKRSVKSDIDMLTCFTNGWNPNNERRKAFIHLAFSEVYIYLKDIVTAPKARILACGY